MGCTQSTEVASGGVEASKSVSKQVPIGRNELAGIQVKATNKTGKNTAQTHPREDGSLDDSVKSFGSHNSARSGGGSGSGGGSKASPGGPRSRSSTGNGSEVDSTRHSIGDSASVGSYGEDGKMRRTLKSSSSIIGLDTMIETRRDQGNLKTNVVHMEVPFGKPIEEVYDGVHTGPVLGSGISGLVRLVTHKATGVKYAVKVLDLNLVDTDEGLARLREEIFIMCQLDHPNIVRLEEVYESHSEIYLVQELCVGGELFDRLDEQPDYHYTEAECARLVKQMLCACRYLHSKGIIHRDLKLENFLFSSKDRDAELKMIDFGLSKHFRFGEVQHEAVGTPYAVAPEVILGSYDERCDIWAIGVISFLLLSGDPPFGGCGGPEPLMTVRSNILHGVFSFEPAEIWDIVSDGAKGFIKALLVVDPKKRPTAGAAQRLPWMVEWADKNRSAGDNVLNPNVVTALINFKGYSDMRKLLCEVLSFTLLPDQIKDLRKEFEKMDTDGSGEISLAALKEVLVTNAGSGSLGGLTEEEVEDIFNAMRVNKNTETRIHWHEFVAAGLSQCEVDDRNLRLAFERLDSDHKGYITFDDISDMLGNDALHSEDMMREMWGDSMKAMNCNHARITYEDFLLLMKGQTRDSENSIDELKKYSTATTHLGVVMEEAPEDLTLTPPTLKHRPVSHVNGPGFPAPFIPNGGGHIHQVDTPLSMDEDEDLVTGSVDSRIQPSWDSPPHTPSKITKPMSPLHESPMTDQASTAGLSLNGSSESSFSNLPRPRPYMRARSRSYDGTNLMGDASTPGNSSMFGPSLVVLPEHGKENLPETFAASITASSQPNRTMYHRPHGPMRLAVIEASKRFEEEQARRARDDLLAQGETNRRQAGLVMRRVENKTVSTEQVRKVLEQNQKDRISMVESADRKSGRRNRTKTRSDIAGMFAPHPQQTVVDMAAVTNNKSCVPNVISPAPDIGPTEVTDEKTNLRAPTVPGEFRKAEDPFGAHGRYGHFS